MSKPITYKIYPYQQAILDMMKCGTGIVEVNKPKDKIKIQGLSVDWISYEECISYE